MKALIFTILAICMAANAASARDISGKVTGENDTPLDFVNVVLYRDSTYLTGTVTDRDGLFAISTDAYCDLKARISYLGYEASELPVPASGDMGIINLTPATTELGEVTVCAARPSTTMKGNALVTNVEGSSLALAGTANDVLTRVPMVVENDGKLEVFGKGAPAIYINGRKVNDLQELAQLNSALSHRFSVLFPHRQLD